ncbi:MAG: hypothetical protein GY804_10755 [Alphaproteobacteria bacterium]|nr:hypothetical protein [Alphaproteobacteria bacterium]
MIQKFKSLARLLRRGGSSSDEEKIQKLNDDEWSVLFDFFKDKEELQSTVVEGGEVKFTPSAILKKLCENYRLDKNFAIEEQLQAAELAKKISQDPEIYAGIQRWEKLDKNGKVSVLEKAVGTMADHYNLGLVNVEIYDDTGKGTARESRTAYVEKGGITLNNIYVNKSDKILGRSFVAWVGTLSHELTHLGDMKKNSKAKNLAIERNWSAYCSNEYGYEVYRNQPVEAHAHLVGDVVSIVLGQLLEQGNIKPNNPYDKQAAKEEYEDVVRTGRSINVGSGTSESRDPYRHFYKAMFHQEQVISGKLATSLERRKDHEGQAIRHFEKAVLQSEFFDPDLAKEAVKKLGAFACGIVEAKGKEEKTKEAARNALQRIAENSTDEKLSWAALSEMHNADTEKIVASGLVFFKNGQRL